MDIILSFFEDILYGTESFEWPNIRVISHSWFTLTVSLEPRKHRCEVVELPKPKNQTKDQIRASVAQTVCEEQFPSFTKPPLLQESRLTSGGSPNLVVLVEWKVPVEGFMGAANSFHWFHPWLYTCAVKQLIQTAFGCYSSDFTLSRAFLSTRTQTLA